MVPILIGQIRAYFQHFERVGGEYPPTWEYFPVRVS